MASALAPLVHGLVARAPTEVSARDIGARDEQLQDLTRRREFVRDAAPASQPEELNLEELLESLDVDLSRRSPKPISIRTHPLSTAARAIASRDLIDRDVSALEARGFFSKLKNGLKKIGKKIGGAFKGIGKKLGGVVKGVGKKVLDAAGKVVVGKIKDGLKKFGTKIVDWAKKHGKGIIAKLGEEILQKGLTLGAAR